MALTMVWRRRRLRCMRGRLREGRGRRGGGCRGRGRRVHGCTRLLRAARARAHAHARPARGPCACVLYLRAHAHVHVPDVQATRWLTLSCTATRAHACAHLRSSTLCRMRVSSLMGSFRPLDSASLTGNGSSRDTGLSTVTCGRGAVVVVCQGVRGRCAGQALWHGVHGLPPPVACMPLRTGWRRAGRHHCAHTHAHLARQQLHLPGSHLLVGVAPRPHDPLHAHHVLAAQLANRARHVRAGLGLTHHLRARQRCAQHAARRG